MRIGFNEPISIDIMDIIGGTLVFPNPIGYMLTSFMGLDS